MAKYRCADGAREVVRLDRGDADRASRLGVCEVLLERLQLDAPRADFGECLGGPKEEIDDRPDEGRDHSEQRRREPEAWPPNPPPRVLAHPERECEPEDDGQEDGDVAGHDEIGGMEKTVAPRHGPSDPPVLRRANAAV